MLGTHTVFFIYIPIQENNIAKNGGRGQLSECSKKLSGQSRKGMGNYWLAGRHSCDDCAFLPGCLACVLAGPSKRAEKARGGRLVV